MVSQKVQLLIENWLSYSQKIRGNQENTIKAYRRDVQKFLIYLSHYYENEVDAATKLLSTAIEPIMLVFIGLVVGFLALSIITPIYDITGSINQ